MLLDYECFFMVENMLKFMVKGFLNFFKVGFKVLGKVVQSGFFCICRTF